MILVLENKNGIGVILMKKDRIKIVLIDFTILYILTILAIIGIYILYELFPKLPRLVLVVTLLLIMPITWRIGIHSFQGKKTIGSRIVKRNKKD